MGREPLSAAELRARRRELLLAFVLALITLAAFGVAAGNGFVDYDDDTYIVQNPHVAGGLSGADVRWALTTNHAANWHPLTWLSLQLDASLAGLSPAQFHLTNVLLHAATALLLFGVLCRMTAALVPSFIAAALFALHPLRVESVAWVAERKDVLSALFFALTLWAYARYAARPTAGAYVAVLVALALGLAAKPMLVTVPFVLLLLDLWPLGRAANGVSVVRLVAEKVPLLALAATSCAATIAAQRRGGAFTTFESWGPGMRLANAVLSCGRYVIKTVWPYPMVPFYPLPTVIPAWHIAVAATALVALTLLAVAWARRAPYLLVGWLWYLGMLVPVIGLVQVGAQSSADRYTYLPSIGLFITIAWGGWALAMLRPAAEAVVICCAVPVLAACAVASWVQVGVWHDSARLWTHTVEAGPPSHVAHDHLGAVRARRGDTAGAMDQFRKALEIKPDYDTALSNLGRALADRGRSTEALGYLQRAVEVNPASAAALVNLGMVLARTGKGTDAEREFGRALEHDPANPEAHYNLALILAERGRFQDAAIHYEAALAARPTFALALNGLGVALDQLGRQADAVQYLAEACCRDPAKARYRFDQAHALMRAGDTAAARTCCAEGLRLDPHFPQQAARSAWTLATDPDAAKRNGPFAVRLAEEACEATGGGDAVYLDVLAAAYAEVGRFDEAVSAARGAIAAVAPGVTADAIRKRLSSYEKRTPWREPSQQRDGR